MSRTMQLGRFSLGVGDRFAHQAQAQLRACQAAASAGVELIPVWNKSHREHQIIGSDPLSVRAEANAAVKALGWTAPYFVDADHVGLSTVDAFLPHADFFTIDVAGAIGQSAAPEEIEAFVQRHSALLGPIEIRGLDRPLILPRPELEHIARHYLRATQEAGKVYRRILTAKGEGKFVTEVSMDETGQPQTPLELVVILAALADEEIPLQTVAPKFTGRFNKGVDYVGDTARFEAEFRADLAVLDYAVRMFGLPTSLKLSVHSGSDKFSLYPLMRRACRETGAGLHLKTAGTTWLEEIIGLAEAGGEGLRRAKSICRQALEQRDELCAPYAEVIEIDPAQLPVQTTIDAWSAAEFAGALRHEPDDPRFNPHLRQLLHVSYKIAAKMGDQFLSCLEKHEPVVARNVTRNLFQRHIQPLFLGT